MVSDIEVCTDQRDKRLIHVKARCKALGGIYDVSLDCGRGVRAVSVDGPGQREVNAFSKPIKGVYRWDDGVKRPKVFLTWSDAGEPCEQAISLADPGQQSTEHLFSRLGRLSTRLRS